jgi:hypothetical protein
MQYRTISTRTPVGMRDGQGVYHSAEFRLQIPYNHVYPQPVTSARAIAILDGRYTVVETFDNLDAARHCFDMMELTTEPTP